MDKLLIAEANGEDRFGRKMRYQWFLDWKFCLKAKGFFSIRHGTILQVTNLAQINCCLSSAMLQKESGFRQVLGAVATLVIFLFQLYITENPGKIGRG